ncbi:helix-turn-helix transcriptional regulator [Curtobacterium flaccumfaciens pv. oortii]|uniref:helix-turn-helix transcriptional regulator n=1 Tax=Curtobacterium flaccumfaciens TaxID=2035 RepID=UPI0026595598|nr:helix-turn-helix transcriptional regulator [Curtobacterium flaccumfaciens]MCS5524678.1 helix-turn-helix transcriptional regulator [Curtobacterium flaccumfaciens pv. oortii]
MEYLPIFCPARSPWSGKGINQGEPMDAPCALQKALDDDEWERIDELLDARFFRYLANDPDLLRRVFRSAPAGWFVEHPRQGMQEAIATAVKRPGMVLDSEKVAEFRRWVQSQQTPAMRDVLGVQQAELRELLAHGWYQDASLLVDDVLSNVQTAPQRAEGFSDVMPSVLLRCGMAKLLAANLTAAAECFADAIRWATLSDEHPLARYAREHLALVHALEERFADASALLPAEPITRSEPGTLAYHYEPAGLLARVLISTASLDLDAASAALTRVDDVIGHGDLGWVAMHARTRVMLTGSGQWDLIHRINTLLITGSKRTCADTIAGSVLRADLAGLYQSVGDLRAAESVLSTPGLLDRPGSLVIPLARQALLRGRPEQALGLLRQNEYIRPDATPARHLPTGAILYATAELAASGDVATSTLELAATTVNYHHAYSALAHASPALRERLIPLVDRRASEIPEPWTYRDRVKLTPREREVLAALNAHQTINQVAAALHVSPNTAKTHVRALYKKLGAHTRDEALWLGQP